MAELPSSGIARDIYLFVLTLLQGGKVYSRAITTTGDSATHALVPDLPSGFWPALTIINQGANNIRYGYNGAANLLLPAGASITLRGKRPAEYNLVYNDLGVAGIEIDVVS